MAAINTCAGLPSHRTATLFVRFRNGKSDRFRDECSKHGVRAPYAMTYEFVDATLIVRSPDGGSWTYPTDQVKCVEVLPRSL